MISPDTVLLQWGRVVACLVKEGATLQIFDGARPGAHILYQAHFDFDLAEPIDFETWHGTRLKLRGPILPVQDAPFVLRSGIARWCHLLLRSGEIVEAGPVTTPGGRGVLQIDTDHLDSAQQLTIQRFEVNIPLLRHADALAAVQS